jgi:hypothetical protein
MLYFRPDRAPDRALHRLHEAQDGKFRARARVVIEDKLYGAAPMRRSLWALPAAFLFLAPAFANAADPPARVGRLSYADGTVSFHPADQGDWWPATVNYPVTTGESFWTDANSRAEIEIGPAALRLDQASELDISRLDDRSTDLQLDQGVLNLHLAQMPPGETTVLTPRGRVVITAPGSYDIDVGQPDNDQPSDRVEVSVFEGAARFEGDRGSINIGANEAAVISGDPMDVQLVAADASDFDRWALDREHREDLARLPRAVPPAVTGYQDLAQYGNWGDDPEYGEVWYPSDVPVGWAPYRYGHWAWVAPWGWTWIDDAPWGFAPFHYGRWIVRDDRWAWVPVDIPPQPVYAPALVAFIGGDGWGVDLAAGAAVAAIGWVALAPHESYHPHYRASETYDRRINGRDWNAASFAARNTTLNNFRNRQTTTIVPTAAFTHAAPVQRATVAVAPDQLARTRATAAAVSTLRPSATARVGRADPAAAAAVIPQPNARANVARGRVAAATPPALAQQQAPTAPGPHRVADAARPTRANAPAINAPGNAPAPTAPQAATPPGPSRAQNQRAPDQRTRDQARGAPNGGANGNLAPHPAPPNAPTANAPAANAPAQPETAQRAAPPNAPSAPRGPAPVRQPRAERRTAPNAPANANLAPHPVPPNQAAPAQPPREATRGAPNAPVHPDLAQRPAPPQGALRPNRQENAAAPPNAPPREATRGAPNAPARPDLAPRPAPPQGALRPNRQENAAAPSNAPPRAALAQPRPPAAPPPARQATAPAPAAPRPEAQARSAAPPRLAAPPQVAHTPAPMPPRAAPPPAPAPRQAAPPPAPHPAAAPAPHPPAAPPPRAVAPPQAPHPAAAAPHPPAAPPQPPRPAAAPAQAPHPAPAAKAPPPGQEKKEPPH